MKVFGKSSEEIRKEFGERGMDNKTKPLYEFGPFRINTEDRLLFKENEVVPLAPKVFDILLSLVEKSGRVLDKDELIQQVWADTFVEEGNLARNVSTLRKALGESEDGKQYIETIPRRGYRFVSPVREVYDNTLLVRESSRITIEQEEIISDEKGEASASDEQQISTSNAYLLNGVAAQSLPAVATVTSVTAKIRRRLSLFWALGAVLILLALISTFLLGRISGHTPLPSFHQLTFRRGYVWSARFAPDGQTVIYSALWENKPSELFTTRPETPESRSIGLTDMGVLSISRSGELAVLLKPQVGFSNRGTLARMPLTGGAPREVLSDVQSADWSPDNKELAVSHWVGNTLRIEYPIGKVLYEAKPPEWLSSVRISPKGDKIAFLDYPSARFDDKGYVAVIDLEGNKKIISREYTSAFGLAWSPSGDEIFFSASEDDLNNSIRAVTLSGEERLVARAAGRLYLFDVSPTGKALADREDGRIGMIALPPGETRDKELSWLDGSWLRDVSPDGKTLLFDEEQTGGGATGTVYIRNIDGSPAVNLGAGHAMALSPDGKWALAHLRYAKPRRIVLYPTGAGEAKVVVPDATNYLEFGNWFPDSRHILLRVREPDHEARLYIQDIDSGESRPALQEGLIGRLISPDGKFIIARGRQQKMAIHPIAGGEVIPINGLGNEDAIIRWGADGNSLYVMHSTTPVKLYRLNFKTGQKELLKEIFFSNATGLFEMNGFFVTPDGTSYAYTYSSLLSDLFLVDGCK
jgi:eukaryotic-like serine/threonine-protein kinase